jgi:hypothetical protein
LQNNPFLIHGSTIWIKIGSEVLLYIPSSQLIHRHKSHVILFNNQESLLKIKNHLGGTSGAFRHTFPYYKQVTPPELFTNRQFQRNYLFIVNVKHSFNGSSGASYS